MTAATALNPSSSGLESQNDVCITSIQENIHNLETQRIHDYIDVPHVATENIEYQNVFNNNKSIEKLLEFWN